MDYKPSHKVWRVGALTVLSCALLAACGGGDDSGNPGQQPSACPAAASASLVSPSVSTGVALIAKLKADAVVPTASAVGAAGSETQKQASGDTLANGLRLHKVIHIGGAAATKSAANTSTATGSAPDIPALRFARLQATDAAMSTEAAIQLAKDTGLFEYVEPDVQMKKSRLPNDNLFSRAWHLKNTGQFQGGVVGFDIGAENAWNYGIGTRNTVVAVVDDGIHTVHPDLAPNLWRNPGEIAGNCVDDDGNGIKDDLHGADMVLGSGDVDPYFPRVDSDHGTMVSGVIAAQGNNAEGAVGVNWNTQVMSVKVEGPASSNYSLFVSDFVDAFNYILTQKARGVNVRVINVSYGTPSNVSAYRDVIVAAGQQGILVVVPTGNDGSNVASDLGYPSNWQLSNVISVGASTPAATRAVFSNYGSLATLFAPGESIVTTSMFSSSPTNIGLVAPGYRSINGTSFAAPVVAGAAALLMDTYPMASMAAVRAKLINTSSPFGVGERHLNLAAAIATAP
jgi:subtilisin family serine protease